MLISSVVDRAHSPGKTAWDTMGLGVGSLPSKVLILGTGLRAGAAWDLKLETGQKSQLARHLRCQTNASCEREILNRGVEKSLEQSATYCQHPEYRVTFLFFYGDSKLFAAGVQCIFAQYKISDPADGMWSPKRVPLQQGHLNGGRSLWFV